MHIRMIFYPKQVHNVALDMPGKRHKKVPDWFEADVETNELRVPSQQWLCSVPVMQMKKENRTFTFEQAKFRSFLDLFKSKSVAVIMIS